VFLIIKDAPQITINSYKQLDYLSFNSKPLISTTNSLYVASQNNITAYSVPSLKKGKSVKLDKKQDDIFVLLSQKTDKGYKSKIYKVNLK